MAQLGMHTHKGYNNVSACKIHPGHENGGEKHDAGTLRVRVLLDEGIHYLPSLSRLRVSIDDDDIDAMSIECLREQLKR